MVAGLKDVNGKHIWIIGASSGIGAALAKELAVQGAIIALSARREDKLSDLAEELAGTGHLVIPFDVSDEKALQNAQSRILDSFPVIDSVLFMAVSYKPHERGVRPLPDIRRMMDVNLGGAFNLIDAIVPQFTDQGYGQLILCASVAGYRGLPTGQPYCASKAALINLGESLKLDLEHQNIDVKIICPGFVKTPLTDKNDFPMPMIIEADQAAKALVKGICSSRFEIHFPKKFTYIMKLVHILPHWLYFALARKMRP